jgi:hypothetical protein
MGAVAICRFHFPAANATLSLEKSSVNPCKVCELDQDHRAAVDEALQSCVPLDTISRGCGIGRSSLHRHFHRHVKRDVTNGAPRSAAPMSMPGTEPVLSPASAATSLSSSVEPRVEGSTKQQLICRIEQLWAEGLDGLASSKEPIFVTRADGSTVELKGDLRARKGFIVSCAK